jgi:hypothetical protein
LSKDMAKNVIEGYRLSPQQRRVWRLLTEEGRGVAGVVGLRWSCVITIEGLVSGEGLAGAVEEMRGRHEILRTGFQSLWGMEWPLQVMMSGEREALVVRDLRGRDAGEQERLVEEQYQGLREREFDYEAGEVMHVEGARLSEGRWELLVSISAMCADEWSLQNLAREVVRLCDGGAADEVVQYADFAEWQNELLESEEEEEGRAYWREREEEFERVGAGVAKLGLEQERRGERRSGKAGRERVELTRELAAGVESLAVQAGVAEEVVLLAAWKLLLWRLTEHSEVIVETAFDGRRFKYLHEAFGLFNKYLPLHTRLTGDYSFGELLSSVESNKQEANKRQEYYQRGGEAEELGYGFEYRRWPEAVEVGGVRVRMREMEGSSERFKLKIRAERRGERVGLEWEYDEVVMSGESVRELQEQYQETVGGVEQVK